MAKVTKYEAFLNEKLRPDLKACLEDRDNIYAEIAEYASLKKSIEGPKCRKQKCNEMPKIISPTKAHVIRTAL